MDRISRIQNPKALHVVQLIIIIIKQIYRKGKKKSKKRKLVGWLVVSIWMRLLSSASLPRSMRAPCSSPLWDLGLLHPSHLFCVCVIGWIWCFFVYLTSTWLFLFSPPLSLHDACVISSSLTHTNIYNSLSSNSFFQSPHSLHPLLDQITRTSFTLSLSPQSFRIPTFTPLFQLLRFSFSPKNPNHEPCIHPISTAWQHQSFYSYYSYSSIPSSQQQAVVPSTTPTTRIKHYSTSSL